MAAQIATTRALIEESRRLLASVNGRLQAAQQLLRSQGFPAMAFGSRRGR